MECGNFGVGDVLNQINTNMKKDLFKLALSILGILFSGWLFNHVDAWIGVVVGVIFFVSAIWSAIDAISKTEKF